MKKRILIFYTVLVLTLAAWTAEKLPSQLESLVREKKWSQLSPLFADTSHETLKTVFAEARALSFTDDGEGQLTYHVRYENYAEMGKIFYAVADGRIMGLSVKRGVSALKYIETFVARSLSERQFRLGDALVTLKNGTLYQARPLHSFCIFVGDWEFSVAPKDPEEALTLRNKTGAETLTSSCEVGGFVLDPATLPMDGAQRELSAAELPPAAASVLQRFQGEWGHEIAPLGELWYLPFQGDFAAVLFEPRQGGEQYRYIYNPSAIPDTTLFSAPKNMFLLYYNSREGIKLAGSNANELESMNLRLYFDHRNGYIAGTSELEFSAESDHKQFSLADGLLVKARTEDSSHSTYVLDNAYHVLGEAIRDVTISYAGRMFTRVELLQRLRRSGPGLIFRPTDHFLVMSRDRSFYPNPGLHFFKSRVFVSSPDEMKCLVSGELKSIRHEKGLIKSVFESNGLKDIVMICGKFELRQTLPGRVPVNLYAAKDLNLHEYFRKNDIPELFAFLLDHFPELPISELNLLLNRGSDYGGVSHPGLIMFNVVQTLFKDDSSLLRRIRTDSPVVFNDINRDNLIHELSHQWWGGVISWRSYQDQWITEGLAQFSTLFHLQKTLSAKAFARIINDVRRWVLRKSSAGPMVYGQRILNLEGDMDAFQSVVYNRGALLFLMFKEMLGERAFLERLGTLIREHKYQSLSSGHFIRILSQGDELHQRFFNRWVFSRAIPHVFYGLNVSGNRVRVSLRQDETDFVFPLQLTLKTDSGTEIHTLLVRDARQELEISAKAPVQSAEIDTLFSPVNLDRE